jgi:hypothetical protein
MQHAETKTENKSILDIENKRRRQHERQQKNDKQQNKNKKNPQAK